MAKTTAPKHLSAAAKRLWQQLKTEYVLDDVAAEVLLESLCESFDRIKAAREQIARDGMVILDRFGAPRAHPAVNIEHAARMQLVRAIRALRLAPDAVDA